MVDRPCEVCGKETGHPDDAIMPLTIGGKLKMVFFCKDYLPNPENQVTAGELNRRLEEDDGPPTRST